MRNRNKFLIGFLFILAVGLLTQVEAGVKRIFEQVRLPTTQAVLERQLIHNPIGSSASYISLAATGPTSAAAFTQTTFTHQPDVPRNITITPTGVTADNNGCTIVVSGTNIKGTAITENFVISAAQSSTSTGAKAFATLTSVAWPASCEASPYDVTWNIGVGSKLGLRSCMDFAGDLAWAEAAGIFESTRPAMTVNSTAVESNTAIPNTSENGSTDFILWYVQNFRCLM